MLRGANLAYLLAVSIGAWAAVFAVVSLVVGLPMAPTAGIAACFAAFFGGLGMALEMMAPPQRERQEIKR